MATMFSDPLEKATPKEGSPAQPRFLGSTRLLDFCFAAFLIVHTALPGLPVTFPAGYIAMGVLVVIAATRRTRVPTKAVSGYLWIFVVLIGYYAAVSATGVESAGASDWVRRLIRIAMLLLFVVALATWRLDLWSVIRGVAAGLAINAALFFLGLSPRPYGEFLTGFAGDKNTVGMLYAVGSLLLIATLSSAKARWVVLILSSMLVFQSGSRTAMAAMAVAMVWVFLVSRWSIVLRIGSGALIFWILQVFEERYARIAIFADRWDTDWFRQQIAEATRAKIATVPPQGMGLGEAYVIIPQGKFFFHNSYDTLIVEGGVVALAIVVGVLLVAALRPVRTRAASLPERCVEGAAIVLLVCAWQLGEVFLTVSWGLVVASGLYLALQRRLEEEPERSLPEDVSLKV